MQKIYDDFWHLEVLKGILRIWYCQSGICTIKGRMYSEHNVRAKSYYTSIVVDEDNRRYKFSVSAWAGGCRHAVAFLMWIHRRSEEPSALELDANGKIYIIPISIWTWLCKYIVLKKFRFVISYYMKIIRSIMMLKNCWICWRNS